MNNNNNLNSHHNGNLPKDIVQSSDSISQGINDARNKGKLVNEADSTKRNGNLQSRGYPSSAPLKDNPSQSSVSNSSIHSKNSNKNPQHDLNSKAKGSTQSHSKSNGGLARARSSLSNNIMQRIPHPMVQALNMAKKAKKGRELIRNSKSGALLPGASLLGLSGLTPKTEESKEEQEAAIAKASIGEEHEEGQTSVSGSAYIGKIEKRVLIGVMGAIMLSAPFIGVIMLSSMTDTSGHGYLASKLDPTEEQVEKWYTSQDNNDSSDSDSSSSASSSDSSSTSSSSSSSSSSSKSSSKVVEYARGAIGVPYVYGGTDYQNGMDCSGLVFVCYHKAYGFYPPRTTEGLYASNLFKHVQSIDDLVAGDLIENHSGHVMIYTGEGTIIEEPDVGQSCIERSASSYKTGAYAYLHYIGKK